MPSSSWLRYVKAASEPTPLRINDLMQELGCTRWEAQYIMAELGQQVDKYRAIPYRKFRQAQLDGTIANLLSSKQRKLKRMIAMLEMNGYTVTKYGDHDEL